MTLTCKDLIILPPLPTRTCMCRKGERRVKDNDNLSQAMHVHVYGLETRLQYLAGLRWEDLPPLKSPPPPVEISKSQFQNSDSRHTVHATCRVHLNSNFSRLSIPNIYNIFWILSERCSGDSIAINDVIHHANCRTRVVTLDCIKINLRGSIKPKHFWGECP